MLDIFFQVIDCTVQDLNKFCEAIKNANSQREVNPFAETNFASILYGLICN